MSASVVKVLQWLAVGFHVVVDEHTRLWRQAVLGHQMKLDVEVAQGAKSLEENQAALALEVSPNERGS